MRDINRENLFAVHKVDFTFDLDSFLRSGEAYRTHNNVESELFEKKTRYTVSFFYQAELSDWQFISQILMAAQAVENYMSDCGVLVDIETGVIAGKMVFFVRFPACDEIEANEILGGIEFLDLGEIDYEDESAVEQTVTDIVRAEAVADIDSLETEAIEEINAELRRLLEEEGVDPNDNGEPFFGEADDDE